MKQVEKLIGGNMPMVISNGVVYGLQPKASVSSFVEQIKKEVEEELKTKQAAQKFIIEFGKNIGFFTLNNWKVLLDTYNDELIGSIALKVPGGFIEKMVYCPPGWCIGMINTGGNNTKTPLFGLKMVFRHSKIPIKKYLLDVNETIKGQHHQNQWLKNGCGFISINPHAYEGGAVCTGHYQFPVTSDIDRIVAWLRTFTEDWLNYNPSSPVTNIRECKFGHFLYGLAKSKNPPSENELCGMAYLKNISSTAWDGEHNLFAQALEDKVTKDVVMPIITKYNMDLEAFLKDRTNPWDVMNIEEKKIEEACK